jgi:hypothetical protein
MLYEFFVQLRESVFDIAEKLRFLSDEDYLALGRVFKPDQQYMIEQVRADSLVDINPLLQSRSAEVSRARWVLTSPPLRHS